MFVCALYLERLRGAARGSRRDLAEPRVHDEDNVFDGDGRLGDVRAHDDLGAWGSERYSY